ncbi:MAG: selenocysteine-specific translation elongation factor [Bacteroidetes bacterium]|nr:selenocysteine-specific translation elongation factor [Bacteroidota bacterium]
MKHLILGTAGHIDHGKTALVKALTGYDCDTHKEEKARGITINLGFTHLDLPAGETLGVVDVPGHKDFIKTMVAGAFGIDIALLIVAADSGIMPQTAEHVKIIEMLGVHNAIVALTKTDLVDKEMEDLARLEIMEFLEGTSLENSEIIGVSSLTGNGLPELIQALDNMVAGIDKQQKDENFRLYIDRLFNVKGLGYVATGTVINGKISEGEEAFLLPGKGKKIRIKGIERHGIQVNTVCKGDRAALNLSGIKQEEFRRGMILSGQNLPETKMVDALVSFFDHKVHTGVWSDVMCYSGTFECAARMHLLDKDILRPGEAALVQLHLKEPAILMNKDKFILRNSSNDLTLGGGTILDNQPLHHRKRTKTLIENLTALMQASLNSERIYEIALIELLKENQPVLAAQLSSRLAIPEEELIQECLDSDRTEILLYRNDSDNLLVHRNVYLRIKENVLTELKTWHGKYPLLSHGMDERELAGKMGYSGNSSGQLLLSKVLQDLLERKLIRKHDQTWVLADHKVNLDPKSREQISWLETKIKSWQMEKPALNEIESAARENKISGEKLKMYLTFLSDNGKIYYKGEDIIHIDILNKCRTTLLKDLITKEKGINEKEFRELINGTKKMVQLLLTIFLSENIIRKETFYIHISPQGKNLLQANNI